MSVEHVAPGRRLRIAVLGDFDGVHARSWLAWFIDRGHDVHAVSYYAPATPLNGVTVHALRPRRASPWGGAGAANASRSRVPRGLMRLAHGARYIRAGLGRTLREIAPDVTHAHFVVEHGFYGALARVHPYVVTAWGSDILVEPERDPISKMIARWTLRQADLATSNNAWMAQRMVALGARRDRVEQITLGADRYFMDAHDTSVNVVASGTDHVPTVLSTRAHEPLYNIAEIIDAYDRVARQRPDTRLVIAHGGSLTPAISRRAGESAGRVEMLGFIDRAGLREAMRDADVFVSIPSSDGTSVALLQAMAAGCFPIVSDLNTQHEWIEHGVNGFRVPLHRPDALADHIRRALDDGDLRRRAAEINRTVIEERGLNENEMAKMERLYLRLAGRPLS